MTLVIIFLQLQKHITNCSESLSIKKKLFFSIYFGTVLCQRNEKKVNGLMGRVEQGMFSTEIMPSGKVVFKKNYLQFIARLRGLDTATN